MVRQEARSRGARSMGGCALALLCLALANCTATKKLSSRADPRYGVSPSPRVIPPGQPVPKGGGAYRVGKPYVVAGRTYYPSENRRYRAEGVASWYGEDFHGRLTANGEIYDMESISAAHPTLPMPSYARVTNLRNGRSLIVRVNDRGPYHDNRLIDLSHRAAKLLDFRGQGIARVRVEYVGAAALEGSDDRRLMATLTQGRPAPPPSAVRIASARPFVPVVARPMPAERPVNAAMRLPARGGDYGREVRSTVPGNELTALIDRSAAAPAVAGSARATTHPVSAYSNPTGLIGTTGRGLY